MVIYMFTLLDLLGGGIVVRFLVTYDMVMGFSEENDRSVHVRVGLSFRSSFTRLPAATAQKLSLTSSGPCGFLCKLIHHKDWHSSHIERYQVTMSHAVSSFSFGSENLGRKTTPKPNLRRK